MYYCGVPAGTVSTLLNSSCLLLTSGRFFRQIHTVALRQSCFPVNTKLAQAVPDGSSQYIFFVNKYIIISIVADLNFLIISQLLDSLETIDCGSRIFLEFSTSSLNDQVCSFCSCSPNLFISLLFTSGIIGLGNRISPVFPSFPVSVHLSVSHRMTS